MPEKIDYTIALLWSHAHNSTRGLRIQCYSILKPKQKNWIHHSDYTLQFALFIVCLCCARWTACCLLNVVSLFLMCMFFVCLFFFFAFHRYTLHRECRKNWKQFTHIWGANAYMIWVETLQANVECMRRVEKNLVSFFLSLEMNASENMKLHTQTHGPETVKLNTIQLDSTRLDSTQKRKCELNAILCFALISNHF